METPEQFRLLLDIAIAAGLGGLVGLERESKEKPAGFRTNILVATAAALFLIVGRYIAGAFAGTFSASALGIDPTRIIHSIIVGATIIGAGTIIKSPKQEEIYYLTTAATILLSAGIGTAVGLRLYYLAGAVTLLVLLINWVVGRIYG